ncbi:MAG: tetratricopeptide repeat protein [Desulfobulbus sp.]|jgi:tetratricopeptide (TPR) repeat protein
MQGKRIYSFSLVWLFALLFLAVAPGCSSQEKNKETHYKKAMVYLEEQKDKEAIIELRNAIQIDPKYADARYQLGLLLLKSGEPRQAFEQLQRASTLDPDNIDAKLKTAEFYVLAQKRAEARKNVEEILVREPEHVDALVLLANLEFSDDKPDSALATLDKALQKEPDSARLHLIKGRLFAAKEQPAEAERSFRKAVELDDKTMANHAALAAFYVDQKAYDKARDVLGKMAAVFPDSPQPYLQLASIDLINKDSGAAKKNLDQAIKVAPKDGRLKVAVAEYYTKIGSLADAENLYKEAIGLSDDPVDVEAKLANFYFDIGKFDQAKTTMDTVLAKNAGNATAKLVSIKFLLKDGKNQEVLDAISPMIRDYPRWSELYLVQAVAQSSMNNIGLAKKSLSEAIKLAPGSNRAHALLGLLALQEGDFDTAKRESAIALQISPRDVQAAVTLAKSALYSKEYEPAEKMFSELKNTFPSNVEILGNLGLAQLGLNKEEQAKKNFERILTLQPDNSRAFALLLQLAQKKGASTEQLITMTQEQIAKAPKSGSLQLVLATLQVRAGQLDQALDSCKKAQELDPEISQAYSLSALILTHQGKTEQAIGEYKELIAKHPDNLGAYMGLGSLYDHIGQKDQARQTYEKALQIKADFAPAANNLAWLIAESDNPDLGEALRLAMLAKQQKPDDVHIIDTLGWVHYKRGSFRLARSEFELALQKQDDMPVIRYHLALALYGDGDKQAAIAELTKALAQKEDFAEKEEAASLLKKWQSE